LASVYHKKPHSSRKTRLLAPFLPRYRAKLAMERLSAPVARIVPETMLSNDGRYLYVKNSKAACTSVGNRFYCWQTGDYPAGNIHSQRDDVRQGIRYADAVVEALLSPDTFKFTFVRHPVARTVSAFTNFFVDKTNRARPKHARHISRFGLNDGKPVEENFEAFLDYVAHSMHVDPDLTDPHFRTQTRNIAYGHVDYDVIGRVETLEADLQRIGTHLEADCPASVTGAKPASNRSRSRFTPEPCHIARIEALYAQDFEAFGY